MMPRCLACLLIVAFLPCLANDVATAPQLQFAVQSEPKTLDPLRSNDEPSEIIRYLTHASLVRLNRVTQRLEPELAVSWKNSGTAMTLELRKGLRFSNGDAFRAADVCATFQRLTDPKLESQLADSFRFDKGRLSCRVDNDSRVTLAIPEIRAGFDRLLDGVAMQPEKGGAAGLGPYVIAQHNPGSFFVLERNPNYWKKDLQGLPLPRVGSIRIEIQQNKEFEYLRFRKGEFQLLTNLDADLFERLKTERPEEALDLGPSLDTEQLWFNQAARSTAPDHKKAWFASADFRRAISLAIHRDDLAKVVYLGHATPAYGPVSPANRVWHNTGLQAPRTDPAAAALLLRRAGFKNVNGALQDVAGHPVEFSIITNAGNRSRERLAAMIQQDLAAIGMKVTVAPLDMPGVIERVMSTFNYDACLLGFIQSDPDPNSFLNVWVSSGSMHAWNPGQLKPATEWEAKLDELMARQAKTLDPAARKKDFDEVQRIAWDMQPMIFLVHRNGLVAVGRRVKNAQPSVLRPNLIWNVEQLSLEAAAR